MMENVGATLLKVEPCVSHPQFTRRRLSSEKLAALSALQHHMRKWSESASCSKERKMYNNSVETLLMAKLFGSYLQSNGTRCKFAKRDVIDHAKMFDRHRASHEGKHSKSTNF